MLGVTHSVLPMLSVSPSAQSGQSWVLAAAAVLDAAALAASSLGTGNAEAAKICVRTGTRALLAIADALDGAGKSPGRAGVRPSQGRYEAARTRLASAGVPLKSTADLESQWQEFVSLRERYEDSLFFVARHTFTRLDDDLLSMPRRERTGPQKELYRARASQSGLNAGGNGWLLAGESTGCRATEGPGGRGYR